MTSVAPTEMAKPSENASDEDALVPQGEIRAFPALEELHLRHHGLTPAVCCSYAEAAHVCLSRHHEPMKMIRVEDGEDSESYTLDWTPPDDRTVAAWNNRDDATRDGAYSMCIAAIEVTLGGFAVERAETRTGADYYLSDWASAPSRRDLERAYRLEVSGVNEGGMSTVRTRLRSKVQQTKDGQSDLPAIASVVGFQAACVLIEAVEEE